MKMRVFGTLIALVALQATCLASFDFQLSTVSFNGTNGVVKVSVTPTGESAGNLTNIGGISSPINFSGMSSVSIGSPSTLSGSFVFTNPGTPLVTASNPSKIDVGAIFAPTTTLTNGVTLDLYSVPFTLTQAGTLTLSLSNLGVLSPGNDLGITQILPDLSENFIAGSIGGSSQAFVSAVPEPSSFLFMGLVGVCVGGVRWYKKKSVA